MARQFPTYIFSNPKNTKNKGPFIIHTIFPKCICKVHDTTDPLYNSDKYPITLHYGRFGIEVLECWDIASNEEFDELTRRINNWLWKQIEIGEIQL